MRNNGYKGKRGGDWQGMVPTFNSFQTSKILIPRILGYKLTNSLFQTADDDTALDPVGGQLITLNGSGFNKTTQIMIDGSYISDVGYLSPTRLAFKSPALPAGVYTIYAINSSGGAGVLVPGLVYSSFPAFNTTGDLGTYYELNQFTTPVIATSDSPINYTIISGSLPDGAVINNFNGVITGTAPLENNITTYTFTINANDSENQNTQITLNLTISKDSAIWQTPSEDTSFSIAAATPITPVTFRAVSASGLAINYSTELPAGLFTTYSTNTNTISGTFPSADQDYVSTARITATTANTNRSSVINVTWSISVGDLFWNRVATALTGQSVTEKIPFIRDSSSFNSTATIVGDVKPANFHPFLPAYSGYFNGTADWLSIAHPALSTSWTVEFWAYIQTSATAQTMLHFNNSGSNLGLNIWMNTSNQLVIDDGVTGQTAWSLTSFVGKFNQWLHIVVCRSSVTSTVYGYINGVFAGNSSFTPGTVNTLYVGRFYTGTAYYSGYLHNLRINNGSILYQSFIPSTTFLTAVDNTVLLTAQNPSLVDNSGNNNTITQSGTVQFSATNPFAGATTYSYWFLNSTGYLSITSTAGGSLDLSATSIFTIECWVYVSAFSSGQNTIITNRPSSGTTGYDLRLNPAGTVQFYYTGGSSLTTTATLGLNTWYHLSVIRNGATLFIYINGIIAASSASWSNGNTTAQAVWIGNSASAGANYHQGYISNLRIVNGRAVYTGNFTPPSSGTLLTAITGTTILALTSSTFRNTASTATFTVNGTSAISPLTPSQTTSSWATPTIGSTYFDGSGDYLDISSIPIPLTGQFTFEAWIYTTKVNGADVQVIYSQYNTSNANRWTINISTANKLVVTHPTLSVTGATTFPLNQWVHIAITRDVSNTLRIFLNGAVDATSASYTYSIFQDAPRIGYYKNTPNDYFTGYISNLRVVNGTALYTTTFSVPNSALTNTTGTSLLILQYPGTANNNNIVDSGPLSHPVAKANNVAQGGFSPFSPRGWSAIFNGSSDYYTIPGNNVMNFGSSNWTVEAWVYLHVMPTGDTWPTNYQNTMAIVGVGTASIGDGVTCIIGQTKLIVQSNDSQVPISNNHNMVPHTWYHLAYVRVGNNMFFYVNGTSLGGASTAITGSLGTGGTTWIGCETGQGAFFNGYISNLRVVNGSAIYTGNFTPPTRPLTATQISTATNISSITTETTTLLTLQDGILIDRSYNFSTITAVSAPKLQKFSPFKSYTVTVPSSSAYFNGATPDNLLLPTDFSTAVGGFANNITTIEAWIYPTSYNSSNSYWHNIIGAYQAVAANGRYYLGLIGSATGSTQLTFIFTTGTGSQVNLVAGRTFNYRQWTHVAVVIDATNPSLSSVTFFINGNMEIITGQNFSTHTTIYNGTYIGGGIYGNNSFYGYMSGLRWVKGVAVYTGSFTPNLISTQAGGTNISPINSANILLLTGYSTQLIDYGSYGFTLTRTGSPKQLEFSPSERTFTIGSITNDPAIYGGSYWFDQTGDTLTIPTTALRGSTRFESGNFTIEFWAYPTAAPSGAWNPIVGMGLSGGGQEIRISQNINSTGFGFLVPNGTDQYAGYGTLGLHQWHHFALVRSAGQAHLYKNGIFFGALNMGAFTNTGPIMIAYNPYADGNFGGYLSDIRIIKGASAYTGAFVPPKQSVSLIHNTTGTVTVYLTGTDAPATDTSLGINFESINNAQVVSNVNKFGSTSMYFNGSNQLLYSPPNPAFIFGTGDFTIQAWVYPTGRTATGGSSIVGCHNYGSAADWFWWINPTGFLYLQISSSGTGAITSTTAVPLNTWSYISVTRTSGVVAQYINATLAGTTATYATSIANSIGLAVGGTTNNNAAGAFLGYIADLRITKGYSRTITVPGLQMQLK